MADHHTLLYVSDLPAGAAIDSVSGIARQSRANNQGTGITGLLVFDGASFGQLLEGLESSVLALLERLKADTRHQRMEVLQSATSAPPLQFPGWRLGYLFLDLQEFGVASLRGKRGAIALEAFNFMLPALDIDVGEKIPFKLGGWSALRPR